ncbi:Sulfate adenylyltransferase [Lentibacillus sp. JNUCC-1]|uniref:hypothetical protein n=1 Tax=Lentibacillus sp. JNUCC-1 TaxID=2654513 RepID=UPI001329DC01|nr:hypothetical protein [Lentibacillus sp. JNUCC-1]MUV37528.1 Sulfate adenylyltransferase [Lentibacillus sp. JNUCC-1]
MLDARSNADRIYKEVYDAYTYAGDTNRNLQPEWVADARAAMQHQQEMVISDLEEKVQQAPASASDEYMYQDKAEAEKERDVAQKILADIPPAIRAEDVAYRTWNPMPYRRYRSGDDPEETETKDKTVAGEKK